MAVCTYCGSNVASRAARCDGCGARSSAAREAESLADKIAATPLHVWLLLLIAGVFLAPFVAVLLMALFALAISVVVQWPWLFGLAVIGAVVYAKRRSARSPEP